MSNGETGIPHCNRAGIPVVGPLIGGVPSGLILTEAFFTAAF